MIERVAAELERKAIEFGSVIQSGRILARGRGMGTRVQRNSNNGALTELKTTAR
jgi:hypothetical protein